VWDQLAQLVGKFRGRARSVVELLQDRRRSGCVTGFSAALGSTGLTATCSHPPFSRSLPRLRDRHSHQRCLSSVVGRTVPFAILRNRALGDEHGGTARRGPAVRRGPVATAARAPDS
jgi:hypothetical protein